MKINETRKGVKQDSKYFDNYVKALFIDAYKEPTPIMDDSKYKRYFITSFGIEKPSEYHRLLIKEGFFTEVVESTKLKNHKEYAVSDKGEVFLYKYDHYIKLYKYRKLKISVEEY